MGDNSLLAREQSGEATYGPTAWDPVALEERLKVARGLRAAALARRNSTSTLRSERPSPPPGPAPRIEDLQTPAPLRRTPRPNSAHTAAPARHAHPLVALLALAISVPFAVSRSAPEPSRALQPTSTAAEVVAASQARPLSRAAPPPALVASPIDRDAWTISAIRAAPTPPANPAEPTAIVEPVAVVPVVESQGPANNSSVDTAARVAVATPVPPSEALAAAETSAAAKRERAAPGPASATPKPQRILINMPPSVSSDTIDGAVTTLRDRGFVNIASQSTRLTIRTNSVRFYNAEDAAAAAEVATLVGPGLPGGAAQARDFTEAPTRGAPGHLEIWVVGAPTDQAAGDRPAVAAPPSRGADPDQIRRLVERVTASPALENLRGGAREFVLRLGSDAAGLARNVDAALLDAARALESRP